MFKLYEIPEKYRAIEAAIDEEAGEITPEIEAALDALAADLAAHVDFVGGLLKEWAAEEEAYRKESARFTARASALKARGDKVKARLLLSLEGAKQAKVKGRWFTASLRKASVPTIRWENEDMPIPRAFVKAVDPEVDNDAAKKALKAGTLPPGFTVKHTPFVEIR